MVIVESTCAEDFQPARTVFYGEIFVVSPPIIVFCLGVCLYAQSVVMSFDSLNTDNRPDFSIVFRTRRGDDVNTLDVSRFELLQFLCVAYLLIVDIDLRLALGKDGKLTVAPLHARQHREQVVGCANVLQDRVLYLNGHATSSGLILRNLALHGNVLQYDGIALKADVAHLADRAGLVVGLIADKRHSDKHPSRTAGDDEVAVLVCHAAIDKRGVGRQQQGYVGKFNGATLFINHSSDDLLRLFLDALHGDEAVGLSNLHRIEAYHLTDSVADGLVAETGGDGEVLQFVVNETDAAVRLRTVQVDEHVGERGLGVVLTQFLCLCFDIAEAQYNKVKCASHGLFDD